MDTETLNEYLFANLVTQWAMDIASARTGSRSANAPSSDAEMSVSAEDLRAALAQLDLRRDVVQALRKAAPKAVPPA
jgi:hypothetical protein